MKRLAEISHTSGLAWQLHTIIPDTYGHVCTPTGRCQLESCLKNGLNPLWELGCLPETVHPGCYDCSDPLCVRKPYVRSNYQQCGLNTRRAEILSVGKGHGCE